MKKIDLNLNYDEIRTRIEKDKNLFKPGKWAENIGVSPAIISNVHGKSKQNPSLEYIIAVARFTQKPIEYFLWGQKIGNNKIDNNFRKPQKGQDAINALLVIENINEQIFRRTVADLELIAEKLEEGAIPSPLISIPENKSLGELKTQEKDNI
ncbi:hypothetical protein [Desulfobacter vibrioformis]|uniref:hypothetical protein n=1 Tax=Desulfobacter vibrioformis TaxID=34031 RepID=UPI000554E472|nr:hypothetical protein [Desulfobacter vibrioformis]